METVTIQATAEHFHATLDQARQQLRTLLYSGRVPASLTDDIGLDIAHVCGILRWCCDAVILDPAGRAETEFREAPALIPSERVDYSDLVDAWTVFDRWGEEIPDVAA